MEMTIALFVGLVFGAGIFQMLRRNPVRSILGWVIISNAVNLFLLCMGAYEGKAAPYVGELLQKSDALPQALVLTAIVISMGGFALLLAMMLVLSARRGKSDLDEFKDLKF